MAKVLPVHELDFIKIASNHQKLVANLERLNIAAPDVTDYAAHVSTCWYILAIQHLSEAKTALAAGLSRAVYSRAYYAAYNASKSVRYFSSGAVSLAGDDHKKAGPDLPADLPDVARWSGSITTLYEHRLRADYDNWGDSANKNTISPNDAITTAEQFLEHVQSYMNTKYGMSL